MTDSFDLIVIGGGPGGYVAAIRAAQLGMVVALVEKAELGGVCLNWGCIPTKALLKSAQVLHLVSHASDYGISVDKPLPDLAKMVERSRQVVKEMSGGVQYLLKKNGVKIINGFAQLTAEKSVIVRDKEGEESLYSAPSIVLATGGSPRELPALAFDGKKIINSTDALMIKERPDSMAIVGGGAIGVEFAYFFNQLGTTVTLIEYEQGLVPLEDKEVSLQLQKSFESSGIQVEVGAEVVSSKVNETDVTLVTRTASKQKEISADIVLSAVGVNANIQNIGLESCGIEVERGKIKVDEFYRTSAEGVFAIGDIITGPALAHMASAEGILCVEKIAGLTPKPIDYNNVPSCIYCHPEIASVGYTEQAAMEAGFDFKKGVFPLSASGKAKAMGATDGFIKVLYDNKYGEILGAHLIGENVTEIIAELTVARGLEATWQEIVTTIHPHPTISEVIPEAVLHAAGEAIHI